MEPWEASSRLHGSSRWASVAVRAGHDLLPRSQCYLPSALRFAEGGEFAPVEVEVGQDEVAAGEEEEGEGEGILRHVEKGRDRVEDAGEDEVEGEDVGADHPLAVNLDLAVAGGEEGARVQRSQRVAVTPLAKKRLGRASCCKMSAVGAEMAMEMT